MAILPDNEYIEFENRAYVNPQVSLDEQTEFIDKLRQTQQANNQQIKTDTYNLGTAVPSNLGGLTGGEGYFTARYQTPQTNSLANDLRATAQASALSQVLENEQAKMKNRYNKAYHSNAIRNANSGNKTPTTTDPVQKGEVEIKTNDKDGGTNKDVDTDKFDHSSFGDFVAGKGERTISYTIGGKTYYANIFNQTGISGERYTGMDTSTGMSYSGQNALDFLRDIVSRGGKIYGPNGEELTPEQALTGSMGR